MIRSIIAIVAGFIFICALAFSTGVALQSALPQLFGPAGRIESVPMLWFTLIYVFVFAVSGCYLTARLAPQKPMKHALILGLLGLIFNIVGTILVWQTAPAWYHLTALAMVMPAAWLGGWLRENQAERVQVV